MEYYNHISSETGTEVIVNEFKLAGIYDAIRSGKSSLQSIDPFNDIAPLADSLSEGNLVILYNHPMIWERVT